MAIQLAAAYISISGRTAQFERDVDRAQGIATSKIRQLQGLLAAFSAVGASVYGAFRFADLASDAAETESKFRVVFSNIAEDAERAAEELRNSFGLGRSEARKLLGDTGDLLTGFGFTQAAALELSEGVQKLAVDLASFTNIEGGTAQASEALTKALLGERESVKALGIAILEEDVKARVALNTSKGLTFETERQAKAYATLQLAQEQSKNAIGDYARTSGGMANQMRLFKTRLTDAAISIGNVMVPALETVLPFLTSGVERFTAMNEALGGLPGLAGLGVAALGTLTAAMYAFSVATGIQITLLGSLKRALIGTGYGAIIVAIGSAIAGFLFLAEAIVKTNVVQEALARNVDKFRLAWLHVKEAVIPIFDSIAAVAAPVFGFISDSFGGLVTEIVDYVGDLVLNAAEWFRVLVENWRTVLDLAREVALGWLGFIENIFMTIPNIVGFAFGRAAKIVSDTLRSMLQLVEGFAIGAATALGFDPPEINLDKLLPEDKFLAKIAKLNKGAALGFSGGPMASLFTDLFPADHAQNAAVLFSNLAQEKGKLENMRADLFAQLNKKGQEIAADAAKNIDTEITVSLKSGFFGFEDFGRKVQEAFLKKDDNTFDVRIAGATEQAVAVQERMLAQLEKLNEGPALGIAAG